MAGKEGGRSAAASVSRRTVTAFRLTRHHLAQRAPRGSMMSVLADIAGAQAQIESAAKISLWARVHGLQVEEIDTAVTSDRTIVKTACMRRTLHLVPSAQIAMFVRGTSKCADRDVRWILNKGATPAELDRVITAVLDAFSVPSTRSELVQSVAAALDLRQTLSADGWWGNTRKQPAIRVGPIDCPPNYLLALASARGIICYGENRGTEPTFVRADAWLPDAADLPVEAAEERLLRSYLRSYGPATAADFVAWTRMRHVDALAIWRRLARELVPVEVDGGIAYLLASDRDALLDADFRRPNVRLLPYFDTFLLGHAKRTFVAPEHHSTVYRKQGWVSSVLLIDGRVCGTWSYEAKGKRLSVHVRPFSGLSRSVARAVEHESDSLAGFLGCEGAETEIEGNLPQPASRGAPHRRFFSRPSESDTL